MDCLFCKIVRGEMATTLVLENEHVLAFHDIRPVAPTHVLVIPRKHIARIDEASPDDALALGHVMLAARDVARRFALSDEGFRVVVNSGEHAGQSVFHVHAHVLGGRSFAWPPG
jgi:histidine triad (HIT) family protein